MTNTPTFFEGPEKKLEIAVVEGTSLREMGDDFWHRIVQTCEAQVLSKISSDVLDAYLLSESSLFVAEDYVTMITCGRTQLVRAAASLIEAIGQERIGSLFYERKNEHFPDSQPTTFFEDAKTLNGLVEGHALQFGLEHEHAVRVFQSKRPYTPHPNDTTLEILMHGIAPSCAAAFCKGEPSSGPQTLADELGLFSSVMEKPQIDEFCFTPAGYSVNALGRSKHHKTQHGEPGYATYHVTPEELGSYVSFETNIDFRDSLEEVTRNVISHFRPVSFDIVSFTPSPFDVAPTFDKYSRRNHVCDQVGGFTINFFHFFEDFDGPRPPIPLPL